MIDRDGVWWSAIERGYPRSEVLVFCANCRSCIKIGTFEAIRRARLVLMCGPHSLASRVEVKSRKMDIL